MPADRPGQGAPVGLVQRPQARQPQEQTAQLGAAEWPHLHPPQEQAGTPRQRVSTGHQHAALGAGTGQAAEHLGETRVGEGPAVLGEVALEVVEEHQQPVFAQQPPDQIDLRCVLVTRVGQRGTGVGQLRDTTQHVDGLGDQRRRVPTTDMYRDSPAVGPQPGQHPPGHRGLADTAGPGQHYAGDRAVPLHRGPAAAQHVQRGTDLAAPPDQIPHGQLADGATGRRGERAGKRTRVRGHVQQRRVVGRGEQRRGGVLGRGEAARGARGRPPVGVHLSAGSGEGRRHRAGPAGGQFLVEHPGQIGRVTVGDGRLHGHHPVGATPDQGRGQPVRAGRLVRAC